MRYRMKGTRLSQQKRKYKSKDAFCKIENGELILYNVHISPYSSATYSIMIRKTKKITNAQRNYSSE